MAPMSQHLVHDIMAYKTKDPIDPKHSHSQSWTASNTSKYLMKSNKYPSKHTRYIDI